MDFFTFILYFIFAVILATVLQRIYDAHQKRLPGPIGLPFVGRLPFIIAKAIFLYHGNLYEAFSCDGASYGDARFLRAGTRHVLILSSFEAITEAIIRQPDGFSERPSSDYLEKNRRIEYTHDGKTHQVAGGIGFSNGQVWKENRRFALRVLRDFGMGKNILEAKVQTECQSLVEKLKLTSSSALNPNMHLTKAVSNIICQIVFGFRLGYEDPDFEYMVNLMKEFTQYADIGIFLPVFYPFLENETYYRMSNADRLLDLDKKLLDYVAKKVDEVEEKYNSNDEPSNYVEAFIRRCAEEEEKEESRNSVFSGQQLIVSVTDLFIAGTDTTSNALNWAFICAAYYPEYQQQLHDELDEQLGSFNDIKYADRLRCPKTQAFLDEVMRYCTIVPHNVERESKREIWFRDRRISPNTYIIADIRSVHRSPELWKDPDIFRPTRFLNDQNEYQPSKHLISFSIGKRSCLGESLARVEFFLFFATTMRHFQIKMDSDTQRKGKNVFDGTDGPIYAPKDHKLIFTQRL